MLPKKNIVILTGAGISAESGLKTFRDSNGLWENHRIEEVATPQAFQENPSLVHKFYNARRAQLKDANPNAAHTWLVKLEKKWTGDFLLVTQNVDNLHDKAGSKNLVHMHGELIKIRCEFCKSIFISEIDCHCNSECKNCGKKSGLRPHIVWFGEMPIYMDQISISLENCDYFVSIGTSGEVYPAAGFVTLVPAKCKRIEINNKDTAISRNFHDHFIGPASIEVPKWVQKEFGKLQN